MNRKEEMTQLREQGMTLREIGEIVGLSKQRVCQILGNTGRKNDIRPNPRKDNMLLLRSEGRSLKFIADQSGVSKERVRQIIGNTGHSAWKKAVQKFREENPSATQKEIRQFSKSLKG